VKHLIPFLIGFTFLIISCKNYDEKVKNESESNNIKVTIDSTTNNNEKHTPLNSNRQPFYKDELVHTAKINNSKYELYKNMVIIDTSGSYDWSVTSLSIHKNGTKQKVLLKQNLDISIDELTESWCEVNLSPLYSDNKKQVVIIDYDCYPSAPGNQTIMLIQFEEEQIKYSKSYYITGRFESEKNQISGRFWTGFYAAQMPLKIVDSNNKLELKADTSIIHKENEYYYLKVKNGITYSTDSCELVMFDNPFSPQPSKIKVKLMPQTEISMIHVAVDQIERWDYFGNYWLKIRIGEKEGWIKDYADFEKIGCQAAG
tara:strand:- start:1124 stop:2068 length:945 start_codon:yes stop_codon:yes gene_type:complete